MSCFTEKIQINLTTRVLLITHFNLLSLFKLHLYSKKFNFLIFICKIIEKTKRYSKILKTFESGTTLTQFSLFLNSFRCTNFKKMVNLNVL